MKSAILSVLAAACLLPGADNTPNPNPNPNHDRVGNDLPLDQQRPTAMDQGSSASDIATTQSIRQVLVDDSALSTAAKNITVVTRDGTVSLVGDIPDAEHRRVRELVAKVAGVRGVKDYINANPTHSPAATDSDRIAATEPRQGTQPADEELTRRVRKSLANDADYNDKWLIESRDGVVWVDGRHWTPAQRARIEPMISNVEGVKRVDTQGANNTGNTVGNSQHNGNTGKMGNSGATDQSSTRDVTQGDNSDTTNSTNPDMNSPNSHDKEASENRPQDKKN